MDINLILSISVLSVLVSTVSVANEDANAQPAFAKVTNFKILPKNIENKINTEYEAGKSSYRTKAKFLSKIANEKAIKISIGGETFFLLAFPELVHLTEGFGESGVDAQSACDVIQFRQENGVVSILPQDDVEGECLSYFRYKPMVMDLDQDGNSDIVFFGNFRQPQIGGETTAAKVFLFNDKSHSFCYSATASEYIDGDLKDPKKILENARSAALRDSKKFTCS